MAVNILSDVRSRSLKILCDRVNQETKYVAVPVTGGANITVAGDSRWYAEGEAREVLRAMISYSRPRSEL